MLTSAKSREPWYVKLQIKRALKLHMCVYLLGRPCNKLCACSTKSSNLVFLENSFLLHSV